MLVAVVVEVMLVMLRDQMLVIARRAVVFMLVAVVAVLVVLGGQMLVIARRLWCSC
jgi:hypothetical protein